MVQHYEGLVAEIDRIVASPYPTQLKSLHDIVSTKCTRADVAKWAASRPCQIERLANCLLDGLRQWPYVLDLLTILASQVAIRNTLLQQCPTLLYDLISHAVKAASLDSKYVAAAVTLLSNPLPEHITMPSEAQTLFVRLFDQAADDPSLANIRQVYKILKGTSSLLLALLPSSSLSRLEQHLFDIIRNIKGENQSLSLYCLAIMKVLCSEDSNGSLRFSHSQYDTQELLASTQLTSNPKWSSEAIQQFFTGGKAQKTIQLVVLRSMWACTTSTGEPFDERIESLLLANEVIAAIPPHLREVWRRANSLIVGKLQDKTLSVTLEPELNFQGLCFLAQVSEGSRVPVTVLDGLRSFMSDVSKLHCALSSRPDAHLQPLMEAGVFDETVLSTLLQQTVDFVAGAANEGWLETSQSLLAVIEQIYAAIPSDSKLGEGTMLASDVISCGQKLPRLLALTSTHSVTCDNGDAKACGRALRAARCRLTNSLCKLFLRAALSSPHQSYSPSQDTVALLLELHASSVPSLGHCSHADRRTNMEPISVSFAEASGTPEDIATSWRDALHQYAQFRAQTDAAQLTEVFARACSDLETRCEGVEQPLQEAREQYATLQKRYDGLEEQNTSLKASSGEQSIRLHAVEMERDQYINDLETQREEMEANESRIEELLMRLQQVRDSADQARQDARNEAETAGLQHAAACARKDEELEELQQKLGNLEHHQAIAAQELADIQAEYDKGQEVLSETRRELENAERCGMEREDEAAQLRKEVGTLTDQVDELSASLSAVRGDAAAQREAFERDLGDMKQQYDADYTSASSKHDEKVADLTRTYEENTVELRRQLAEMHDEVGQAREQHRADIEQWELEIGEKQKKIDRLSRRCSEKDKRIAEANSMRTNLMAAMGFGGAQLPAAALPSRALRSSATQRTRHGEMDNQDDPSPPTPFSGDDSQQLEAADVSFASNATSSGESRNGPTPKRLRPRRSIKTHSPAKPASRLSVSTRSGARAGVAPQIGRSSVKVRQPLLGVSGNQERLPGRPSLKTPSKHVQDGEDSFGGSEIFAGTQGFAVADLGAALDEETETGL